jgi:phosphatidylglycerophosphatase A
MNTPASSAPTADVPTEPLVAPLPALVLRPDWRFLLAHPAHFIALGAGSGLARVAPGTSGTLWAWVAFLFMDPWLNDIGWASVIVLGFLIGWWACTVTARHMGVADSGHIVWDEVIAFWLVLWMVSPSGLLAQFAAFALFRLLDSVKVGPMAWADRHFKGFGPRGGFGILFDDILAAFCTLLLFAAWRF